MGGGWEGGPRGRGYGDICIHIADSLHCTAETNTRYKAIIFQQKEKEKKKRKAIF